MGDALDPGGIYRLNYQRSTVPLDDSITARRRLLSLFMRSTNETDRSNFVGLAKLRMGVDYPGGDWGSNHKAFWEREAVGVVLSAITIWYRVEDDARLKQRIVKEVQAIFDEEHLNYRMAPEGGIHPRVDDLFEQDRSTTIAGLEDPRFVAARVALQKAFAHLKTNHPSGKGLIREVFEATESTYLVVIANPKVNNLNERSIENDLKPKLLARYASYTDAGDKVERLLTQFKHWTKTAHPFRHGTAEEQEHEAPIDIAVLMTSEGMAFIRYLAAL
ncbi:hypothetical protein LHFGNBLO_001253 [Mesorhizobium sp. AR10]|uniref:hypothetical protein n=1 Tax=Mesorhizobium sp. AR10 TaxID=2865839 RepID=UPI00216061EE|nr:hypothetical protein [Mesorhizobium sp. AR10]UVK39842.1 hypothetical protein LHFGNBLO_001253 [Mesorhizobium sp. AR10]